MQQTEWIFNIAGTALEIGLTIAAFFTGCLTAVLFGLAGGAVGLGMAAYNFEIAEDVSDAVQACRESTYQFADFVLWMMLEIPYPPTLLVPLIISP